MLTSLVGALIAAVCTAALLFSGFLAYGLGSRRRRPKTADFVVVLGTTLAADGQVPPLLAARLDRARAIVEELRSNGDDPTMIVSGGKTTKDRRTEASAMAEYQMRRGARGDRMLVEDESCNTGENIRLSGQIMHLALPDGYRCVIVTSDYHCPRVAVLAWRNGLPAGLVGSTTPARRLASGAVRDFAALVVSCWKLVAVVYAIVAVATAMVM